MYLMCCDSNEPSSFTAAKESSMKSPGWASKNIVTPSSCSSGRSSPTDLTNDLRDPPGLSMSPDSSEARDLHPSFRATSSARLISLTALARRLSSGDAIPRLDFVSLRGFQPGRAKSAAIPRPLSESSSSRVSTLAVLAAHASKCERPISTMPKPHSEDFSSASRRGIWPKRVVSIASLKLANG